MPVYKRSLAELKTKAVLHWPNEILSAAGDASVLPLLLRTQDFFIALLKVADSTPTAWLTTIEQSTVLTGQIFLKHLMVMTDLGGEALNKLPPISAYCPNGILEFVWKESICKYQFKIIGNRCALANSALRVSSKSLLAGSIFTPKMIDVAMLLLFGSAGVNDTLPMEVKERCIIGTLIGRPEELDRFAKENYIRVSRQVAGATSNALGQLAQDYVVNNIRSSLPQDWHVTRDKALPNVSHTIGGKGTNFDVVVESPQGNYFGIEVSFQVTTNSVIERKARESESLMRSVHTAGHKVCYVIDGAGNINIRQNAIGILCSHSDCTFAMSVAEIRHLAAYFIVTNEV